MLYPYNGWLAIDKPLGMSSNDVVIQVRKLLGMKKVGHAGTLDPLATGVLLVAVGEATKLVSYAMNNTKKYSFTLSFGYETDTDDKEGKPANYADLIPTKDMIVSVLGNYKGVIAQIPPIYSAIKKNGKKLCDLARAGKELPEIEPRNITIHSLSLDSFDGENADFTVACSKGTYVRSLGRDIARDTDSRGHISRLERISIGDIDKKMIISLDKLKFMVHNATAIDALLPVESVLDDIPVVDYLAHDEIIKIRCGVGVEISLGKNSNVPCVQIKDISNTLVAIGTIDNGILKPVRGFNLSAA